MDFLDHAQHVVRPGPTDEYEGVVAYLDLFMSWKRLGEGALCG